MLRIALLTLLFTMRISAQTPNLATLHGRVTDLSHAPVSGAIVSAVNAANSVKRTAQTNGEGGLPIGGQYTVTATKQGFAEASVNNLTLEGGAAADINLELSVAPGTLLPNRKVSYLPLLNAANRQAINQGDVTSSGSAVLTGTARLPARASARR